jgi:hypothetical protein
MSSWDKLPAEIIVKIAKELTFYKDIIQFQLTCKGWAPLVQRRLYFYIRLTTEYQLNAFIENITANPALGLLVERLDVSRAFSACRLETEHHSLHSRSLIRSNRSYPKLLDYFTTLTEYCPNVRQILKTLKFGEEIWLLLIKALQEGKWKHVHLIQSSAMFKEFVHYEQAVWEIRDKLTELQISDVPHQNTARSEKDKQPFYSVAEKIFEFPKVQNLTLIKEKGYVYIFDFNEHIDSCVLLKKLRIISFLPHLDPVKYRTLRERRMFNDISTIKQQHAVEELHVILPLFRDDSLTYIMHKFPSLSTLKLRCFRPLDKVDSTSLSYEVCRKFLEYISKIQFVSIFQLRMKNVHELLPITFKDRIKYGKRKTLLIISYCDSLNNEDLHLLSIETKRNHCYSINNEISHLFGIETERSHCGSIINVEQPSDFMNQTKCDYAIHTQFPTQVHHAESTLMNVPLIESLGNEITALQLNYGPKYEAFTIVPRSCSIDHAWANCSQLEHLLVVYASLIHCSSTLPVKKHLDTLHLKNCNVYHSFFNEISPLLPSLGSLHLENCFFFSGDHQQLSQGSSLVVDMLHSSIDNLRLSLSTSVNSMYVKVKVHDKKEKYYAIANIYSPVLLTGSQAESLYHSDNGRCCYLIDLRCYSLGLLYFKSLLFGSTCYGIDFLKNKLIVE